MKYSSDTEFVVWLYGSHARGDWDELSDVDIFVAGRESQEAYREVSIQNPGVLSISRYGWEEIERMAVYGSLFLHHLKLEGKPLLQGGGGHERLDRLLSVLPPYQLYRRDIMSFQLTVGDVEAAVTTGSTPEFELAVLGTVVRHASVLSCYLLGSPCFGRTAAVEMAAKAFGFDHDYRQGFAQLYEFRLSEDGRMPLPFRASWKQVQLWAKAVRELCEHLGRTACAYEDRLSGAHPKSACKCS